MNFKKGITFAALTALLAVPAFGTVNATHAHAANVGLDQAPSPWEKRARITKWEVSPYNGFHNVPNGGKSQPNYATKTFSKNGHTFTVKATDDSPGTIIGVDGNNNASDAQVMAALNGRLGSTSGKNNNSNQSSQSSQSERTNSTHSLKPEYQTSSTNHGKLVQTGEHGTAKKAGVAAVVVALVAFVIFKFKKVFKRN